MGLIKPHHRVLCRDCRSLNESARPAQSWLARPRPGIKRRPGRKVR